MEDLEYAHAVHDRLAEIALRGKQLHEDPEAWLDRRVSDAKRQHNKGRNRQ